MKYNQDDSAADLRRFVKEINRVEGEDSCRVIQDIEPLFDAVRQRFPPYLGGIDWRRATLVESSGPSPDETNLRVLRRIMGHWRALRSLAAIEPTDRVLLLSDDYFDAALDCAAKAVPRVLEEWLRFPHAIVATNADREFCLHISFSRGAYLGKAEQRREGGAKGPF